MKEIHLEEKIYDYLMKHMSKKEYRLAEEHVKRCQECQKRVEELRKTLNLLDQFQPPPLSDEFKAQVLQEFRKVPLPRKSLSYRIKEWFQVPYIKWSFEAMAVAMLLFLIVTFYTEFSEKPIQTKIIPKKTEITFSEVKHPIIVETADPEKTLEEVVQLIHAFRGKILHTLWLEKGIKVTFSIDEKQESRFFSRLTTLGEVHKKKEGYKDKKGNIVMVLMEEK